MSNALPQTLVQQPEATAVTTPLVQRLLDINTEHSALFVSPDVTQARRKYRALHPTELLALKCMDGRVHLPVATQTPLGIIQPARNLGGKFNVGWPFFSRVIEDWVDYSISRGRDCIVFVTYHFSRSNERFGCAGFNYDTAAARAFTLRLKQQLERVFGPQHAVVYPIQVGFETDLEALILHGSADQMVDLSTVTDDSEDAVRGLLTWLFPDMKPVMRADLTPIVQGNIRHIAELKASGKPPTALEHREWVLAVGRGFDWLHRPNEALIVGPWSPNLDEPIETAARIIRSNLESGRIPNNGWVLASSAPYRDEAGVDRLLAIEKARVLYAFAREVIGTMDADFLHRAQPLISVVNQNTRKMEMLDNG